MIPIKDYNPTRRFPLVSVAFIVLNVIIFILDRISGHYEPLIIETSRGLIRTRQFVGGLSADFALVPAALTSHPLLAWPTVFSSMFLHGNWLHIGSNMLYLWIFGNNVEDVLGRGRFILFYFTCGGVAALAQVMSAPGSDIPMVGASGAVAGVMGAYLLLFPRARILTLVPILFFFTFLEIPAFIIIGYWVLIQFLNATWLGGGELLRGGVAYFAHIGGFVAGVTFVLLARMGGRGGYGRL
ncbi:rhomboid family intramembrane serine protease [Geobacter hydrogenophilus]|uniref:Rhomboid family intramembrane serine protease n=1 Tax=Geobacter hydrogenophilus TaxID=40983 RepID=A0A9W6LBD4_9BACT|nr:rhomboid family intramembrane serine protease [Geobacter hydrogenophilus]MBT0895676.1 rhomboid family intramembrane serine protease [Geobacter hydrogenophilus]GLI36855.1 rhomboid family intramembrane serine protease [Geobacter hydrogenophilus]